MFCISNAAVRVLKLNTNEVSAYMTRLLTLLSGLFVVLLVAAPLTTTATEINEQTTKHETSPEAPAVSVPILYLTRDYEEPLPLSLVDKIYTDKGLQGARIGLEENNRTGEFLGQKFSLIVEVVPRDGDIVSRSREHFKLGQKIILADLESADLLAVSTMKYAQDAVLLNIRAGEDNLRQADCRRNIFHITPSWAMRADALAQYFVWKKWLRWLLVRGKTKKDIGFAAALKRAAKRFGIKVVDERTYEFDAGSRRTDTGHQQIQKQMPRLTQSAPRHDAVVVSDVAEAFGDYLMFRTFVPRPVAGTHGLVSVAWHRSYEQYAAMQMQNRFEKKVGRIMTERDYIAWLAVRAIGEATIRTGKTTAEAVRAYFLSDQFEVAAFKGIGLTFRPWNQQLRQPMLLSSARALVSMSPQEGFLHKTHLTDTLGIDQPESICQLN